MAFWQAFPKHNLGLLLKVTSTKKDVDDISPHDLGLVGDRFAISPRESFMVAYLKNGRNSEITLNRSKRSPEKKKKSKSSSRNRKKQFSHLEQDFEYDNVYRDFTEDIIEGEDVRRGPCMSASAILVGRTGLSLLTDTPRTIVTESAPSP